MTAPRFELTSQRQKVSRSPTEPPGRPAYVCMYTVVITFSRVRINREMLPIVLVVPVLVLAVESGLARRVQPSRPASACSFSIIRLNLVLTHGISPDFRGGVHLIIQPYAIGSVPSLSSHAIAYRWRSLSRGRRHRVSSPQGSSSNGRCLCRSPWDHTGGRSHRISPPSFCGACLNFYREKDSAVPFPRRP